MPVTIKTERSNPILSFLPPTSKSFIEKCGEVMDEEALGSWILHFGIQQLQDAYEQLTEKFLPDELEAINTAVRELHPSLTIPPLASAIGERVHGTQLLRKQAKTLSNAEIFVLTFFVIFDSLLSKRYENEKYLSPTAFARMCKPPCSRAWICDLCKRGRVPGAFKDPATGRWRIPKESLGKIQIADRAKRVDGELVYERHNRKKDKYQCPKKTSMC